MVAQGFRASSAKHRWHPDTPMESGVLLDSGCRYPTQHQFVTARAFYPLLLAVCHPASSAYIITLDKGVGHSWALYCFHNAQRLRSTAAGGLPACLGIIHD